MFAWLQNSVIDAIIWVIERFTQLFGLAVTWFGDLLNWVFQIQAFTSVPVVQVGWTIARDLSNMFFILVLLLIGFATILRYENYGVKRLLPRLIIVALLVNFSLLFAGVFIDIGNDLGMFFVSGGNTSQAIDIGENAMAAIGLQKATTGNVNLENTIRSGDGSDEATFISAFMRLILTIVVAFLFMAMALIMVFRMVALWILLIFLPLALVASIVPAGSGVWKNWTKNFVKWSFFPAIFGLFMYIGLLVGDAFNSPSPILGVFGSTFSLNDQSGAFPLALFEFLQYIIVVFILFLGLIQANKQGLNGASWAMGVANQAKGRAVKYAKKGSGIVARSPVSAGKGVTKATVRALPQPVRQGVRGFAEKAPLLGRKMGGPGAQYKKDQAEIKKFRDDFKKRRPTDLQSIIRQKVATPEGQLRRVAAMQELASKGGLTDKEKKYFGKYLNAGGKASDLISMSPTWAFDEEVQKILVEHSSTKKDWGEIADIKDERKRDEAVMKIYSEKYLPTKPDDIASFSKSQVDISKEALEKVPEAQRAREEQKRKHVRSILLGEFQKTNFHGKAGKLHSNTLTAMANKNPGMYEELMPELESLAQADARMKKGGGKDKDLILQNGVRKHIENGPGFASSPSSPPPPSGGGGTP